MPIRNGHSQELPSGSNALVLLGGSTPEALFGQVPDELVLKLKEVGERSFPAGEFGLEESIRTSHQWLASSPHPRRQLVLISDFQKHEWSNLTEGKIIAPIACEAQSWSKRG